MSERELEEEEHSRINLNEILFILFKQKRKILFSIGIGVIAAAILFFTTPAIYKSNAKLFVPYVVDRTTVEMDKEATPTSRDNDAIMNSETEILTSWDLAAETAASMKYEGVRTETDNADLIRDLVKRIEVTSSKGMNVITVSYTDRDPKLATHFLEELLKNYREKHLKVHRSPEALDVLVQRRNDVRSKLEQTEDELRRLKKRVQVLSLVDTTTTLSAAIAKNQEDLNKVEAELRGQEARVESIQLLLRNGSGNGEPAQGERATNQEIEQHRSIIEQVAQLRAKESQLLLTYPPDSRMVRIPRKQIGELEAQRRFLEKKFPDLAVTATTGNSQTPAPDLISEKARLAALRTTSEALRSQLEELNERREHFADLAPQIAQLERDKELLEGNYKNVEATLSKAQDDKAVDWSKIPNIASLQEPSPAIRVADPLKKKIMLALLTGGLACGIGMAFFQEMLVDRTVKRTSELEDRLGIPVLLSVPLAIQGGPGRGNFWLKNRKNADLPNRSDYPLAPWAMGHFIRPYCEAIRDRMILAFELRNLNHKPKLIGVTGFSKGAGSSTLAGGLAAALSETGDGKVLLVDMNVRDGEVHPFFNGKAASSLSSVLEPKSDIPSAADNLYLATISAGESRNVPMGLKRFYSLVPSLKKANFDYIIFDMPALSTGCPSLGMSAFMDKVLLVIEAERDEGGRVKRLYSELAGSSADVTCVFNKARSYAPKWIEEVS